MNLRMPSCPRYAPSTALRAARNTHSSSTHPSNASTSPRLIASLPSRKASTFSCDIATPPVLRLRGLHPQTQRLEGSGPGQVVLYPEEGALPHPLATVEV